MFGIPFENASGWKADAVRGYQVTQWKTLAILKSKCWEDLQGITYSEL